MNMSFRCADEDDEIILNVESHYAKAKVGSIVLNIGDCVFVKIDVVSNSSRVKETRNT